MTRDEKFKLFLEGGNKLGMALTREHIQKFLEYMVMLEKWNEKINLTTITVDREVIIKHFIDSLWGCRLIKENQRAVDVGSGAGFPGMVIGIYYPGVKVDLVESIGKKTLFLQEVKKSLGLSNVAVINKRAEEMGRDIKYREKYDLSMARAVSKLNILSEYCLPLVKVGGYFLAYKGRLPEEEINDGIRAIEQLGGRINKVHSFRLPVLGEERNIAEIEKIAETPKEYPRRVGVPKKRPL